MFWYFLQAALTAIPLLFINVSGFKRITSIQFIFPLPDTEFFDLFFILIDDFEARASITINPRLCLVFE